MSEHEARPGAVSDDRVVVAGRGGGGVAVAVAGGVRPGAGGAAAGGAEAEAVVPVAPGGGAVARELLVTGADGLVRCAWAEGPHDDALEYHDYEWGIESHDPARIFEVLTLSVFAAGVRWVNVYRRRAGFRAAFRDYRIEDVAAMGDADVARLMADASIIRNRRKIEATIANARAALALDQSLDELVWSYAPAHHAAPRSRADTHATRAEASALSKRLKAAGFAWVGPSSVHSLMETVGVVNNHLAGCFRATA